MKKETIIKKAAELYDSIIPIQNKIRKQSEEYIKRVLKENDGKLEFDLNEVDEFMSVPYDGGNHPEYASNCFSTVNAIYLDEKGNILLDTEDSTGYGLENVEWDDVFGVADYIDKVILKNN